MTYKEIIALIHGVVSEIGQAGRSQLRTLLVTVGIVYSRAGSNINVVTIILFDGENISFEARLVIYI